MGCPVQGLACNVSVILRDRTGATAAGVARRAHLSARMRRVCAPEGPTGCFAHLNA